MSTVLKLWNLKTATNPGNATGTVSGAKNALDVNVTNSLTTTPGPIQYQVDGVDTIVNVDTGTPASSTPLPTTLLGSGGEAITSTGGALDVNASFTDATAGVVGNPVPLSAGFVGAENPSGDLEGLSVSAAGELLVGSATLATESTLSAASAKLPATLGQKTMAASMAVVVASDQSAIPVSASDLDIRDLTSASDSVAAVQSGTWNINNVSGTVSLPTGAATSANQTTANTSLSSIDGKLASNYGAATGALRTAAQLGNASGAADFGAGNSSAQTVRVVIASNQASIPVTSGGNANGSYAEITNLTTTAQTLSVPANAVGFLLEAPTSNTENVRWRIGSTATTAAGMRLEPGRDTGYIPCAANISVIAESGSSQSVTIQWILSV